MSAVDDRRRKWREQKRKQRSAIYQQRERDLGEAMPWTKDLPRIEDLARDLPDMADLVRDLPDLPQYGAGGDSISTACRAASVRAAVIRYSATTPRPETETVRG